MKHFQRLICFLLAMIFVIQCSPLEAMAEAGGMLSSEELNTAWALTGRDENAAGYREGMVFSGQMNASQITCWLDDLLDQEFAQLQHLSSQLENAFGEIRRQNPEQYRQLTTGENEAYYLQLKEACNEAETLREQVRFYWDRVSEAAGSIMNYKTVLTEEGYTRTEKLTASYRIREAAASIKSIRQTVAENQADWLNTARRLQKSLAGTGDDNALGYNEWLESVRNRNPEQGQMIHTAVSASAIYPDRGNSILARLSPISSALADSSETVTVTCVGKNDICILLKDPDTRGAFQGAEVTVIRLGGDPTKAEDVRSGVTDENGAFVALDVNSFGPDEDGMVHVTVQVQAKDYKRFMIEDLWIRKGDSQTYFMEKLPQSAEGQNGEVPYLYAASFDGHDILKSSYEIYFSPVNYHEFTIKVMTTQPTKLYLFYNQTYWGIPADNIHEMETTDENPVAEWTGKLKQVLNAGKTMFISTDKKPTRENTVMLNLKSIRGIFDSPISDVKGLFFDKLKIDTLMGGGFFEFNVPTQKLPYPLTGGSMQATFPWQKKLQFGGYVSMDGTALLFLGGVPKKFEKYYQKTQQTDGWQTIDPPDDRRAEDAGEQATNENVQQAQQSHVQQGQTGTIGSFFGMGVSFKLFIMFYCKFQYSGRDPFAKDIENRDIYGSINAGGEADFGLSLRWQPHPVLFATLDVTLGITLGLSVGLISIYDAKTKTRKTDLDVEHAGLTITLRFQITVAGHAGIRGVAELVLGMYAYIKLVFQLDGDGERTFVVYGGFGFFFQVLINLAIVSFEIKVSIWDTGDMEIWSTTSKSAARGDGRPWYEMLLSTAQADDEQPEEVPNAPTQPQDYSALVPKAAPAVSGLQLSMGNIRFAELNGEPFAFYISASTSKLTWCNLATGKTGGILAYADGGNYEGSGYDYSYDVQVIRCADYWVPSETAVFTFGDDTFYKDRDLLMVAVASTTGFTEINVTTEQGDSQTVLKPNDTTLRYVLYTLDNSKTGLIRELPTACIKGSSNPNPTGIMSKVQEFDRTLGNVNLCLDQRKAQESGIPVPFTYIVLDDAVGEKTEIDYAVYLAANCILMGTGTLNNLTSSVLLNQQPGSGTPWGKLVVADNPEPWYTLGGANARTNRTFVLNGSKLERRENDAAGNVLPLAEGNIVSYQVLQNLRDDTARTVFYLEEENAGGDNDEDSPGVMYHLKAAELTFKQDAYAGDINLTVTNIDLDVTLPARDFSLQNMKETLYLYWLQQAPKQEAADPDVYWVRGVVYDPDAMVCSDVFTLAQIAPASADEAPSSVFLSEFPAGDSKDGETLGYYAIRKENAGNGDAKNSITVYSFPFKLVPHVDLTALVVQRGVVIAGTDMDSYLTLMNDGSANINTLDLEVVLEDENGKIIQDESGKDLIVETLHADLLNPDQSSRTVLVGGEGSATGEFTIYRTAGMPGDPVQTVFNTQKTSTSYAHIYQNHYSNPIDGGKKEDQFVSKHLLPSQRGVFVCAIHIPEDWAGGTKHIVVRLAGNQQTGANGEPVTYGTDSVRMTQSKHDLDVNYRVYPGPDDQEYISISIFNYAETGENLKLYAELYLDGAEKPDYLDLPYYPEHTADGMAQTINMPISALLGGRTAQVARVVIRAAGVEEMSYTDNEFTLYLNDYSDPLRFTLQPTDQTAMEGTDAEFFMAVTGGLLPYSCQWQEYMGSELGWRDIPDATDQTLSLQKVTKTMNGRKYRCVVTDWNLASVESDAAVLKVISAVPATGDRTNLPLYLILAAAALALALAAGILRRKRGKREM